MSTQPPRKANTGSSNKMPSKTGQSRPTSGRPTSGRPTGTGGTSASARGSQGGAAPRPRPAGQPAQRPRQRPPQPKRGLRNSDLAFIFVGLVLVGALIWVGVQAANPNNANTASNLPASTGPTPATTPDTSGGQLGGQGSPNYNKSPRDFTPIVESQVAPDFKLPAAPESRHWDGTSFVTLNDKPQDSATYTLSQFKGKTVVLEFFATWCPHCQNDAPMMNQLAAAYKDKNVQVIGVNASPFGRKYEEQDSSQVTTDDVVWFRDSFTVTFPLLLDPNVGTAVTYGVSGYPTVYIVDKDGVVASRPKYPFKYEDLAAALDKVLAK